ncbi:MAG: hypothetical protein CMN74_02355 [Sphingorhabdus sp.]|nr:hypothetical protein [Sphingorhabdus sp.]
MPRKAKPKADATAVKPAPEKVERPTLIPTYPLSPSEIEIILHIRWDGKEYGKSERGGKDVTSLEGDELQKHVLGLPFDPERKDPTKRQVEYQIANPDDFKALLPRAHRVQLVTTTGKLPPELSGDDWNANKRGVAKDDGYGILLHRPFV